MNKTIQTAQIAQATIEKIENDEELQQYLWDAIAEVMEEQGIDIANKDACDTAMEALKRITLRVAG